jgi:hypothetical protein
MSRVLLQLVDRLRTGAAAQIQIAVSDNGMTLAERKRFVSAFYDGLSASYAFWEKKLYRGRLL